MALDSSFVADVLAGMEVTLEELIERLENAELRASLDVLHARVMALRLSIDPPTSKRDARKQAEPVPTVTA